TDCATVNVTGSTGFPRKYYISFDGNFDNATNMPAGELARGDCRLELDNAPIAGTEIRVQTPNHQANHGDGYGINVITPPAGGNHTISVACNETQNDLRVQQFQLSAFQVR
ncbi:MAG: hypothetical protein H0V15_06105, partial [Solirubrobacterales bacterium]|nr:hypothetical protein [Solirubrobacterales bacterium]